MITENCRLFESRKLRTLTKPQTTILSLSLRFKRKAQIGAKNIKLSTDRLID